MEILEIMNKIRLDILKNDLVKIMVGKDKGKQGKVLYIIPSKERVNVIVEGVNFVKRHTRPDPRKQSQGGIVNRESPINISNVMLICPKCNRPTRLGHLIMDDGTKNRICKKCGEIVEKIVK